MMSMACGLATTGKVPYASTFAIFATGRAYDQVRLGIAHNELRGARVRVSRRALARRGRRLAPDDRGHRADARDAQDAGDRPGRLQPGLPRGARQLRARGPDVHALRPARRPRSSTTDVPESPRGRGGRSARGPRHLDLRLRPHGVARARRRRRTLHREEGIDAEVRERRDPQAARLRGRAHLTCAHRVSPSRRRSTARPAASPTRSAPSPPSSTRCRSSLSGSPTAFGVSGTGEAVTAFTHCVTP